MKTKGEQRKKREREKERKRREKRRKKRRCPPKRRERANQPEPATCEYQNQLLRSKSITDHRSQKRGKRERGEREKRERGMFTE